MQAGHLSLALRGYERQCSAHYPRTFHGLRAYEGMDTFQAHYQGNDIEIADYRQKLKPGMQEGGEYIAFLRTQPLRRTVVVSTRLITWMGSTHLSCLMAAVSGG